MATTGLIALALVAAALVGFLGTLALLSTVFMRLWFFYDTVGRVFGVFWMFMVQRIVGFDLLAVLICMQACQSMPSIRFAQIRRSEEVYKDLETGQNGSIVMSTHTVHFTTRAKEMAAMRPSPQRFQTFPDSLGFNCHTGST